MKPMNVSCVNENIICTFENGLWAEFKAADGSLKKLIGSDGESVQMDAFFADPGINGVYLLDSVQFQSFSNFNTWTLPDIVPKQECRVMPVFKGYRIKDQVLEMEYESLLEGSPGILLRYLYGESAGTLKISVEIHNRTDRELLINGTVFFLRIVLPDDEETFFDFPGNVPYDEFLFGGLKPLTTIQTGLVNAVTHIRNGDRHINLIYINPNEKWGTGVFKDQDGNFCHINLAGTECRLAGGESFQCGDLYVQLAGTDGEFKKLRSFYNSLGYRPPDNGITDGVIYSGHPGGVFDIKKAPVSKTITEYGENIEELANMGIDILWLLPLFDHSDKKDPDRNVYTPTDQMFIDPRYGDDADIRAFVDKAKRFGINVIFDYVPHGPKPGDPLSHERQEQWASRKQDGSLQLEWECLSFDMANPYYLEYMQDVVTSHIKRFGIGGARIDCAMGGLSNWKPCAGNRPSCSNMKGGVAMSEAIRNAFIHSNVTPFITPENFHPVPLYYNSTDAYYDMAFYRVLYDLNHSGLDRKLYVRALVRWLENQRRSTPEGLGKLRFLGNHDTVSWVWDCARAVDIYGVERAMAMWVLISFIDGFPMIYQGDEDSSWYTDKPPVLLKQFFQKLFTARKQLVSNRFDIQYFHTDSEVVVFLRQDGDDRKLVLINLGDHEAAYTPGGRIGETLFGECTVRGDIIVLKALGYAVLAWYPA
jgi:glycosidase